MPFAALLAHAFAPAVQRRGQVFYHGRRVRISEGTPWLLRASVQDSGSYEVTLARDGSVVHGACACIGPASPDTPGGLSRTDGRDRDRTPAQ